MSNRFKAKFNIRKGDTVVVIAGEDRDLKKPRKVLEIFLEKSRVLVEGVNIVTRHTKPSAQNTKIQRSRETGKLVRISKKSGEVIK